jgi:hypothetical protein
MHYYFLFLEYSIICGSRINCRHAMKDIVIFLIQNSLSWRDIQEPEKFDRLHAGVAKLLETCYNTHKSPQVALGGLVVS